MNNHISLHPNINLNLNSRDEWLHIKEGCQSNKFKKFNSEIKRKSVHNK